MESAPLLTTSPVNHHLPHHARKQTDDFALETPAQQELFALDQLVFVAWGLVNAAQAYCSIDFRSNLIQKIAVQLPIVHQI